MNMRKVHASVRAFVTAHNAQINGPWIGTSQQELDNEYDEAQCELLEALEIPYGALDNCLNTAWMFSGNDIRTEDAGRWDRSPVKCKPIEVGDYVLILDREKKIAKLLRKSSQVW